MASPTVSPARRSRRWRPRTSLIRAADRSLAIVASTRRRRSSGVLLTVAGTTLMATNDPALPQWSRPGPGRGDGAVSNRVDGEVGQRRSRRGRRVEDVLELVDAALFSIMNVATLSLAAAGTPGSASVVIPRRPGAVKPDVPGRGAGPRMPAGGSAPPAAAAPQPRDTMGKRSLDAASWSGRLVRVETAGLTSAVIPASWAARSAAAVAVSTRCVQVQDHRATTGHDQLDDVRDCSVDPHRDRRWAAVVKGDRNRVGSARRRGGTLSRYRAALDLSTGTVTSWTGPVRCGSRLRGCSVTDGGTGCRGGECRHRRQYGIAPPWRRMGRAATWWRAPDAQQVPLPRGAHEQSTRRYRP